MANGEEWIIRTNKKLNELKTTNLEFLYTWYTKCPTRWNSKHNKDFLESPRHLYSRVLLLSLCADWSRLETRIMKHTGMRFEWKTWSPHWPDNSCLFVCINKASGCFCCCWLVVLCFVLFFSGGNCQNIMLLCINRSGV